jgi:peptidoglycan/xylan/chitin deacetylase (PgdA/CDA1 family)
MSFHRHAGAVVASILIVFCAGAGTARAQPCTPQTGGKSAVSGLALPRACTATPPAGAAANLRVLPWAGFKGAISYTFDDASPSQIENYATLNAPGVPMTFYVSQQTVEQNDPDGHPLLPAWQQVLADGHELGNHTLNHCQVTADGTTLTGCAFGTPDADHATAATQIAAVDAYIKATLGQKDADGNPAVWTMASPFGNANWDSYAQAVNYLAQRDVWTHTSAAFLPPGDVANVYHLPCYAGAGASGGWGIDDKQSSFDQIINDARGRGRWGVFLFHGVAPNDWDGSACCPVPATAIAGSMSHLKGWGDVWGDTVVNVAAYTIGQHLFAGLTPVTAGGTTTWTWTLPAGFPPGKFLRVTVDGGTLKQTIHGVETTLPWNERGFYEVSLSAGNLTLAP